MTVQDLPRFEAFEEWEVQLAPGEKPKAKRKSTVASTVPSAVVAAEAEWKLLRRVVKTLVSVGGWVGDAVWEMIAEWFRDLRRRIITLALGALMGGGYAHQEFNLFGLRSEAKPPVAANDNLNHWKTEVHPQSKRATRNR